MKEDKEKAERAKPKPVAKPIIKGSVKPIAKDSEKPKAAAPSRALPSYFDKKPGPSGVSTRAKAKKEVEEPVPSSYYKPARNRDKKPAEKEKEEAKEVRRNVYKPVTGLKRPKLEDTKEKDKNKKPKADSKYSDYNPIDEIPAELLNQIYSEDLDEHEIERIQQKEFGEDRHRGAEVKPRQGENRPHRLIGGDVEMEDAFDSPIERRVTPPLISSNPPRPVLPANNDETENEMLQRAIEESLKGRNNMGGKSLLNIFS